MSCADRCQPTVDGRGSSGRVAAIAAEVVACRRVPAPGRVARAGRAREAGRVPRRGVLGPAGARVRRPDGDDRRARPGAGGPRRQPHRAGVHRRPLAATCCSPRCYRAGLANQPTSTSRRRRPAACSDAWITAAVKCAPPANKPMPAERDDVSPLPASASSTPCAAVRVVVCLGAFAYDAAVRAVGRAPAAAVRPRRRGRRCPTGPTLLCSFHPSQQNTFTGRLTEPMLDAVFARAAAASPACERRRRLAPRQCRRGQHAPIVGELRRASGAACTAVGGR